MSILMPQYFVPIYYNIFMFLDFNLGITIWSIVCKGQMLI